MASCARDYVLIRHPVELGMKALENQSPRLPFLWTRGIAAREAMHYLDRHGIDAEPLLMKAELSRA